MDSKPAPDAFTDLFGNPVADTAADHPAPSLPPRFPQTPTAGEPRGFASVAGAKRSGEIRGTGEDAAWMGKKMNTVDRIAGDRAPADTVAKEAATGRDAHGRKVKTRFWGDANKDAAPKGPTAQGSMFVQDPNASPYSRKVEQTPFEIEAKRFERTLADYRAGRLTETEFRYKTAGVAIKPTPLLETRDGASRQIDGVLCRYDVGRHRFVATGADRADAVDELRHQLAVGPDAAAGLVPNARTKVEVQESPEDRAARFFLRESERFAKYRDSKVVGAAGYTVDPRKLRQHARVLGMVLPEDDAALDVQSVLIQARAINSPMLQILAEDAAAKANQGIAREIIDAQVGARERAQNDRYGPGRDGYLSPQQRTPRV